MTISSNDNTNSDKLEDKKSNGNKTHLENAKSYFVEFCNNTSIHGFKFLGETERSRLEKIWWFVVITLSLYGCISLIVQTYQKWVSSPVIVSFATSQTPISDIPFPAVTICSDIKSSGKLFKFGDVHQKLQDGIKLTAEEFEKYHYMNMICEKGAGLNNTETKFTDERCLDFITEAAPPLNDTIPMVTWRGNVYTEVHNFFTTILNSDGICYSFNLLDRSDLFSKEKIEYKNLFWNGNSSNWNIEEGFKDNGRRYPRISSVSGVAGGIDFVFHTSDDDIDYDCSPDFVGFKITIQHPALFPRGRKNFITIPLDQIVLGSIKPIMMKTSKKIRNYAPEKRKCYFITEKSLKFFKTYNQPNCLFECLANATFDSCGCVGLDMPRDNSTPICGSGSRRCMEKAKALYLSGDFKTKRTNTKKYTESYKDKCHCLPSCSALDFEVEVSQSNWNWQRVYRNSSSGEHYSRLRLFFKDMQFIKSVRNELYGTTDFLASCGGLLGLFMGFSSISLFEILYFLTLRLCCNIRKYGRRYWSGVQDLTED